jgi:predicted lipid-binding transport protein (Tim44 family)
LKQPCSERKELLKATRKKQWQLKHKQQQPSVAPATDPFQQKPGVSFLRNMAGGIMGGMLGSMLFSRFAGAGTGGTTISLFCGRCSAKATIFAAEQNSK